MARELKLFKDDLKYLNVLEFLNELHRNEWVEVSFLMIYNDGGSEFTASCFTEVIRILKDKLDISNIGEVQFKIYYYTVRL